MNVVDKTSKWRNFEGGTESEADIREFEDLLMQNLRIVEHSINSRFNIYKIYLLEYRIGSYSKDKNKMKEWDMIKEIKKKNLFR